MGKQDNELIETFRQDKLMPDETLEADIKGWLDRETGQGVIQHDGQFVLTNKRACFYSEAPFEEIFETIPLSKITSVETSSLMGYHVLRVHTAHDDLEFKTLEPKDLFDNVVANLERLRNEPTGDFRSLRSVGSRSNDKQPLGLPFEERRLRSALSFHARQVSACHSSERRLMVILYGWLRTPAFRFSQPWPRRDFSSGLSFGTRIRGTRPRCGVSARLREGWWHLECYD